MTDLVGQTIGQYQLIELVSQGENRVYKGFQPSTNRYVAVKTLNPARSADPAFVQQFRQDMQAITTLEHPNILPVYDYGQHDGLLYVVTQYVEDGSLSDQLPYFYQLGPARQLIVAVAEALAHIHSRGLIHGNLKPANILVDQSRHPFLVDFGYTQGIDLEGADRAYVSPEQVQGGPADPRTDVYALGALLYHVTIGTPPPVGVLPSPRLKRPDLPMDVEKVILKALAQDPEQRFQTADEFKQALQMAIPGPAVGAAPPPVPQPAQSNNSRPWIIGGVAALLALVACAILFFSFGSLGGSGSSTGGATAVVPTPAPAGPSITALNDANIRSGPGEVYDIIGLLKKDQDAEAIGRSPDQRWWAIKVAAAAGGQGWVSDDLVEATGTDNVPIIQPPPTPVQDEPQPPQAIIEGTTRAQVGQQVDFTARNSTVAEGSQLVSFAWNFGDGATASGVDVAHVYGQAGTYRVELTITDDKQLSNTATQRLRIDEAPTPEPEEPPVAVINGPSEAQVGDPVTFDARSSQSANPIVSYAWDLGDGTSANAVQIDHVYGSTGVYNVILTVTDNKGLSGTSNVQINVVAAPPEPEPTEPPPASEDLENVEWVLNGTLPGTEITALFQAGTVSGSAGCNTYTGTYQVDGTDILIAQPSISQLACDDEIMEQENRYFVALTSAQSFEVQQLGRLRITGGEPMTFSAR